MIQQNQQPNQKQKSLSSIRKSFASLKLPLIAAIIVIVLAVAGILLLQVMNPPEPERAVDDGQKEKVEEVDTSTWQTYRNDEFGFEVKYPSSWVQDPHSESDSVVFIDRENIGDRTIEYASLRISANKVAKDHSEVGERQGRRIGGIQVYELEDPHTQAEEYYSVFYEFIHNQTLYQFHPEIFGVSHIPEANPNKTFTEYQQTFDQILSTFRFVE